MKKLLSGICLILSTVFVHAQGLENIIVEKYYVSDANDATDVDGSEVPIPAGSVTYRIYVDMLPGYKLQAVYGVPKHELRIATTTKFFNNEDRGATTPDKIKETYLKNNTVMLDSWMSVGAAGEGKIGVPKEEDTDGAIANADGFLQNTDASAGIPIKTSDGLIKGKPEDVTPVAIDLDVFGSKNGAGSMLSSFDGSIASLKGSVGPTADNKVLIAQLTTDGALSFELNIQIGTPDGNTEKYVAKNAEADEIQLASLTYPRVDQSQNTAPQVWISKPVDYDQTFAKVYPLKAIAFDPNGTVSNGKVAVVHFFVDGAKAGEDNTPPYQFNWTTDVKPKVNGNPVPHQLTAVAVDNEGAETTSKIVNLVVLEANAPNVSITSPANDSKFPVDEVIKVTAEASDNDGSVSVVEFFVDGKEIGKDSLAPYEYTWKAIEGVHHLTALATDNDGAKKASAAVKIDVLLVGINHLAAVSPSFHVYPSLTGSVINLELITSGQSEAKSYTLYGIEGNVIWHRELGISFTGKYSERIDVSSLANGYYIIRFSIDGFTLSKKIIKN